METIRTIAIFIEVLLLAALSYTALNGVRLTAFDLGLKDKYHKAVLMALLVVGAVMVAFFVAHLTTFYPPRD